MDSLESGVNNLHFNTTNKPKAAHKGAHQIEIPELDEKDSEEQMNFLVFCKSIKNSTLQGGSKP